MGQRVNKTRLDYNERSINTIDVKTIADKSGNISILESGIDLPFEIKRIYYIWNTHNGLPRGSHAHKELRQAFIAVHGSCELVFNDSIEEQRFLLNDASQCLVVAPGYWRDIEKFSEDCVLMVLASEHYDEKDYIRNYDEYIAYVREKA